MLILLIILTPCLTAIINAPSCNSRGGQIVIETSTGTYQCRSCSQFLNVATPPKVLNERKCICISGHIFNLVKLICDPECEIKQNTNGQAVNMTTGDCTCISGFTWTKLGAFCQLNCSLIPNTISSILNSCICRVGFTFNSLTRTCDLNCTIMPYSMGFNQTSTTASCICQQGYDDNSTTYECTLNCSSMPHATGTTGSQCVCLTNYTWNSTSGLCQFNCFEYANTLGYNKDLICLCLSGYIFSLQHNPPGCIANCTGNNASSLSTVSYLRCDCAAGYTWNNTARLCAYDCSLVRNATGQLDIYKCSCAAVFSWNSQSMACQINCTQLGMTTKNAEQCVCLPKFKFSLTSLSCVLDCSQIPYGSSIADRPKACNCLDRIWYSKLLSCQIDCTKVANAVSTLNDSHCICHASFDYSTTTGTCDLRCVSNVLHSQDQINSSTCTCRSYADWDQAAFKCVMDCTRVNKAIEQLGENECACQSGYVWNSTEYACYIDCSVYATVNINALQCQCQLGMAWSSQNMCVMDCSIPGALGLDPFDSTACQCLAPAYSWDFDAKYCRPNCLQLPNTLIPDGYDGKPIDGVYCKCNQHFEWNMKIGACMLNCKGFINTVEVERTINDVFLDPQCVCRPSSVWNGLTDPGCTLQCDTIPNSSPNTNAAGDACVCNSGYYWSATAITCNLNCSMLQLKQLSATTCQCPIGYEWDTPTTKCGLNCNVDLSTGVDPNDQNSCVCEGVYSWYKPNLACVLDCSKISYSQYDSSTPLSLTGMCSCIRGFTYDTLLKQCTIRCESFSNTDYLIPPTIVNGLPTCSCNPNAAWAGHLTTGCVIDCQTIFASTGNKLNDRTCQCSAGYAWSSTSNTCYLDCIKLNFPQGGVDDCICKPNYYWSSMKSTCFMNCTGKANSDQNVNPVFPDACNCDPKYAWSPITLTCLEDCSQIDFTVVITTPQYFTEGVCICLKNFDWDTATKSCIINCSKYRNVNLTSAWVMVNELPQCPCFPSCTWSGHKTQGCYLNCSRVANSTGTMKDEMSCYCKAGFLWDQSTYTCNLTCSELGMTQVDNVSCSCQSGLVWNLTIVKCQPDCSIKLKSTGSRNDSNGDICLCHQNYSWSKVQLDCLFDCSVISHSNTKTSPHFMEGGVCPCIDKFDFDQMQLKCSINCSKYQNTAGQYSTFECRCQPSTSWQGYDSNGCLLRCEFIQNSMGIRETGSKCLCKHGYYWNSSTFTCDLNCTQLQLTNINATHCDCGSGNQWIVDKQSCYRSCQSVQHSTGSNDPTNNDACLCQQGYVWTQSRQCSFDCSAIAYSYTTTTPQYAVNEVCECISKFLFVDRKCIINCSLYENTDGTVPVSDGQCKCKSASIWRGQTSAGCELDCSLVPHAGVKINSTSCSCLNKYKWSISLQTCHYDCSIIPNAIDVFHKVNSCRCIQGAHWDPILEQCVLNCNKVPLSTGVSLSGVSCQCVQGYTWNYKAGSCLIS